MWKPPPGLQKKNLFMKINHLAWFPQHVSMQAFKDGFCFIFSLRYLQSCAGPRVGVPHEEAAQCSEHCHPCCGRWQFKIPLFFLWTLPRPIGSHQLYSWIGTGIFTPSPNLTPLPPSGGLWSVPIFFLFEVQVPLFWWDGRGIKWIVRMLRHAPHGQFNTPKGFLVNFS